MICINCGTSNTDVVSFCTKCGANLQVIRSALLNPPPTVVPQASITSKLYMTVLVLSALIAILGLPTIIGGVVAIVAVAKEAGLQPHDIAPIILMLTLVGFTAVILSIWLLLRSVNSKQVVPAPPQQAIAPAPQRAQLQAPASYVSAPLSQHAEPISSVTEHTTAHLQDYVAPSPDSPRRS
jgi:hypothetical protein